MVVSFLQEQNKNFVSLKMENIKEFEFVVMLKSNK